MPINWPRAIWFFKERIKPGRQLIKYEACHNANGGMQGVDDSQWEDIHQNTYVDYSSHAGHDHNAYLLYASPGTPIIVKLSG